MTGELESLARRPVEAEKQETAQCILADSITMEISDFCITGQDETVTGSINGEGGQDLGPVNCTIML